MLGSLYTSLQRWSDATLCFEECLAFWTETSGPCGDRVLKIVSQLAFVRFVSESDLGSGMALILSHYDKLKERQLGNAAEVTDFQATVDDVCSKTEYSDNELRLRATYVDIIVTLGAPDQYARYLCEAWLAAYACEYITSSKESESQIRTSVTGFMEDAVKRFGFSSDSVMVTVEGFIEYLSSIGDSEASEKVDRAYSARKEEKNYKARVLAGELYTAKE